MGRRALLAGIMILALLSSGGTAIAAPLHEAGSSFETLVASACAPNPAPAPRGQRTVNVSTPSSGQSVSSAIVVRGTANPGPSFRIVLYGDDGRELSARNMGPIDGDAFVVAIPYRTEREQEGCLWLFNTTGPNWSGNPINVIQVRLLLRTTIGACYPESSEICTDDHFQRFWSGNGGRYQFGFRLPPHSWNGMPAARNFWCSISSEHASSITPNRQAPSTMFCWACSATN